MWRRVTRGLVLTVLTLLTVRGLLAQTIETHGELDFPDPTVTQSGVILVKGWFLAPEAISRVAVYVDDQFIANSNTNLPRIDIVQAYPNWPGIQHIAPGFQIGMLASRFTNGPHTLFVRVFYSDGTTTELGRRTIIIDNTLNQAPFGSVDIPDTVGIYNASGSFPVSGWALDTDGVAKVEVLIDNGVVQNAMYGDPRPDVANTIADWPDALYSAFIANVDTTRIVDGVHALDVRATDRNGLSRLIGRRTVQIFNEGTNLKPFGYIDEPKRDATLYGTRCGTVPQASPVINANSHITPVRGWALDLGTRTDTGRVAYAELMVDGRVWYSTLQDCAFSPIFSNYANCYGLPRFDVERYYPGYPDAPRSGFLFTMDVGALLASGVRPGNHVLKVRVGDLQQTFTELPNRDGIPVFFECAEDRVAAAVGFIDVPHTSDYMKGTVTFQGWAVGETPITSIEIIVDGDFKGLAQLNFPRPDVAQQYPYLLNSQNSGWRFQIDTTKLANSKHRLTVQTVDFNNLKTIIGSVDFYTQNANPIPQARTRAGGK
jgi:hypothetical protein